MICITLSFLLYHGVFSLVNADYIYKIKYMYIKKKVKKKELVIIKNRKFIHYITYKHLSNN